MATFLGFLILLPILGLFVGLIKPSWVIPFVKKPTRLKVVLFSFLSYLVIFSISIAFHDEEEMAKDYLDDSKNMIAEGNYKEAISKLNNIDEESLHYSEASELIKEADSLNSISELNNQKDQLEKEIESLSDGFDFSPYKGTIEALQIEIAMFGAWGDMINEGEDSENPEIQELAKTLKSKVVKIQSREFPRLRKEYTEIASNKMWENDIEVFSNGSKSKYINFTGGVFAANRNKKEIQEQIHEALKMFRFNQSRYRWYEGEDEYTYYTIYEGKDTDLVKL
ncbi:hypothetical protein E7Z59_13680 [Robertkochia marina]|uniref:Uncharacterized protein n=1 Tax=Robertkochia marina TaxID=1227945 RepID=A0A4V3UY11_9FLAO|nr:hypothetical protein [Robertkochia marina]THD66824.1 hypothetical protein E7Z59_13680 [Robertkochia marina]TRZ40891.1 hypothetical protein D3A96_14810 [Robertkochia marina]